MLHPPYIPPPPPKTHKTGSTTLGGVVFRAAVAANRSLYTARSHYLTVGYKVGLRQQGGLPQSGKVLETESRGRPAPSCAVKTAACVSHEHGYEAASLCSHSPVARP